MFASLSTSPGLNAEPKRVAIIGAGLRGLASAVYLKRCGHLPTIFEKADTIGGIWQRVYASSVANTPSIGYTFHHSNVWSGPVPTSGEVLANLQRMVEVENLEPAIRLSTPLDHAQKNGKGKWELESSRGLICDKDGHAEEFDAVLVCSGFLGSQKSPPDDITSSYGGELCLPYAFEPDQLLRDNVTIVGSGATALEMTLLALQRSDGPVSLVVQPETIFYDISQRSVASYCIRSNPLMYFLIQLRGAKPAAACGGLTEALANERLTVHQGWVTSADKAGVMLEDGSRVSSDVLVWCTGWHSDVPQWASQHPGDPTLVVASCQRCLDTGGFGYGTSTAHAKALSAALTYGFGRKFASGGGDCDCEQGEPQYTRHILISLALYLGRQRHGARALFSLLRYGLVDNFKRFRRMKEPLYAKLISFINAPFGL